MLSTYTLFKYNKNKLNLSYFKSKKDIARLVLALIFFITGLLHFTHIKTFVQIVPPFIPLPELMVYISGVFEILGAVGLLIPRYQRQAAFCLVILLIVVLPANIYMAVKNIQLGGIMIDPILLWLRIPFQGVFIWWVLWCTQRR